MEKENNTSSFQFEEYLVLKSEFEINTDFTPDDDKKVEVEFEIDSDFYVQDDKSLALVILQCEVFTNSENHNKPYTLNVDVLGKFKLSEPIRGTDLEELCKVNATAILFPYLRAYISNLTSLSGMTTLNLPTINVHKFIENSKKNKITQRTT